MVPFPSRPRLGRVSRYALLALCLALPLPVSCLGALKWESLIDRQSAWAGDKEVVTVFRFRNDGASPVTITSVTTSCGCTTAQTAKNTYGAGEAGEIKVIFAIGARVGRQDKSITVSTDELPAAPAILKLEVDIQELVTCEPRLVLWRLGEAAAAKSVDIVATAPGTITAIAAIPDRPAITARVEPLEAGKKYRLWLKPSSTTESAVVSIPCTVRIEGRPPLLLTVFASVK